MGRLSQRLFFAVFASLLLLLPVLCASQQQKPKKKEKAIKKEVMNFDGGIYFATEGGLSEQTCFRLDGHVSAPGFFDHFKRIEDENGTVYQSGKETVTEFPVELHVSFEMFDMPCRGTLEPGPRRYLTQEMMKSLRFSFYWKRGIELRHIDNFKREAAVALPIEPFNTESTEKLPERYRWFLEYTIPSAGVPLTDRLALIIRTADGRRAARVAARL